MWAGSVAEETYFSTVLITRVETKTFTENFLYSWKKAISFIFAIICAILLNFVGRKKLLITG